MSRGFPIEHVNLEPLSRASWRWHYEQAALVPAEKEAAYPEPNMFGAMPSQGFFLRHVKNIEISDVQIVATSPDHRRALCFRMSKASSFSE